MDNRGQTGAWEGIIIIILMLCLGGLAYLLFKKDSTASVYKAGSNPRVMDVSPHPSFGGCVDIRVSQWEDQLNKVKK